MIAVELDAPTEEPFDTLLAIAIGHEGRTKAREGEGGNFYRIRAKIRGALRNLIPVLSRAPCQSD